MIRAIVAAGMALAAVCAAFGQSAAPRSFEVVSIKPVTPPVDGGMMVRMRVDAGRLNYSSVSLKAMIQRAFEVQDYQVSGPDWIASTRFDVVAKLPGDATKSDLPGMLQSMLAERFKLAVHREARELPMYALLVARNGPKMKGAEPDPDLPSGWFMSKGIGRWQGHAMNLASLVNMLGALLGRLVVDQTGLKGNYDFDLDYASGDVQRVPPGVGAAVNPDDDGVSLITAVQSQLGLKLEARKGPVEQIVVDHIERTPTEN